MCSFSSYICSIENLCFLKETQSYSECEWDPALQNDSVAMKTDNMMGSMDGSHIWTQNVNSNYKSIKVFQRHLLLVRVSEIATETHGGHQDN